MAWLVRCKNCLTAFSVTKDSVQTDGRESPGELTLACAQCGWIWQYQARDLEPVAADAITPFEAPRSSAAD